MGVRRDSRPRTRREPRESGGVQPSRHPIRAAVRAGRTAVDVVGRRVGDASEAWLAERGEDGSFDASRLIRHADWRVLAPLVERLGLDPALLLPRLAEYVARVLTWNRTASNLVSRADESRLVSRHLRESLEPAAWIAAAGAGSCLDFGSGAGFPALPLALAGVGEDWRLVESRRPKVLFLRKTAQEFGLQRVEPIHSRLERLVGSQAEASGDDEALDNELKPNSMDVFTSRATLRLPETLELAAKVVRRGGAAFLWKGSSGKEERDSIVNNDARWELAGETPLSDSNLSVMKFVMLI